MKYTIEAFGSGGCTTLEATNYREARRIAKGLRNGLNSKVKIIHEGGILFDNYNLAPSVVDAWSRDGQNRWHRVNP